MNYKDLLSQEELHALLTPNEKKELTYQDKETVIAEMVPQLASFIQGLVEEINELRSRLERIENVMLPQLSGGDSAIDRNVALAQSEAAGAADQTLEASVEPEEPEIQLTRAERHGSRRMEKLNSEKQSLRNRFLNKRGK